MTKTYCNLTPNLKISRILTGLWQIADMERDGQTVNPDEAAMAMKSYADAGFTTFDMADHYGSAEIIAGVFRKKFAPAAKLFTKWVPKPGPMTKDDVRVAVQKSLTRLQSEQIDLLQFHAWIYADPQWLDALFWLDELRQEGLIANLGVTNFDTAHLRIAIKSGIPIITNQICYSLLDQRASKDMQEFCVKENVKILAFGTMAGGFFSERWLGKAEPESLSTWSQMKYKRFIDQSGGWQKFQSLLLVLKKIATEKNVSIPNVATKYMLDQPAVGGIIIGARLSQSEHIKDNARLFDFELSPSDTADIQKILATLNPIPGNCGDEYRKPPFLTASGDLSHHVENFPPVFKTEVSANGTTRVLGGTTWETIGGYSRAVKSGNQIRISGTTATYKMKVIGGNDPVAQAHFIIDLFEAALQTLGAKLEDIIRTRIFVRNIKDWEAIARVHGVRFKNIQPANTLVEAKLVGDEYLVEIEADAVVGGG